MRNSGLICATITRFGSGDKVTLSYSVEGSIL
jgi:hypothetical protein